MQSKGDRIIVSGRVRIAHPDRSAATVQRPASARSIVSNTRSRRSGTSIPETAAKEACGSKGNAIANPSPAIDPAREVTRRAPTKAAAPTPITPSSFANAIGAPIQCPGASRIDQSGLVAPVSHSPGLYWNGRPIATLLA